MSKLHEQVFNLIWDFIDSSIAKSYACYALGEVCGVHHGVIMNLSRGVKNPDVKLLETLYNYLNETPLDI